MQRFGLRDDQWDRIGVLPGREGHVGGNAADNRLFVEAIHRYRTGIPWRDLPARFGDWKIVHECFSRWAKSGVRTHFQPYGKRSRQRTQDDRWHHRARSSAQRRRAKNGPQAIGRSRGGLATKIHAPSTPWAIPSRRCSRQAKPRLACAEPLIENADPDALLADKAYDADSFIDTLTQRGELHGHPAQGQPQDPRACDFALYCERNLVERFFNQLKHFVPLPHVMTNSPEISRRSADGCRYDPAQLKTGRSRLEIFKFRRIIRSDDANPIRPWPDCPHA